MWWSPKHFGQPCFPTLSFKPDDGDDDSATQSTEIGLWLIKSNPIYFFVFASPCHNILFPTFTMYSIASDQDYSLLLDLEGIVSVEREGLFGT